MAIDGLHKAEIDNDIVKLQMQDVNNVEQFKNHIYLNTGSPHHVQMELDLKNIDVKQKGSEIRYNEAYGQSGSNVNFVFKNSDDVFSVRTYERGVEDETLSCGTGVTAVALAMHYWNETNSTSIKLNTEGGQLEVSFKKDQAGYSDIWLIGPAKLVFKGEWE
jgi:diaminopimelate epimerase